MRVVLRWGSGRWWARWDLRLFFDGGCAGFAAMSLNRAEQMTFDYLQQKPDEKRFWEDKVRAVSARARDPHTAALELEGELWRYYEERSAVASPFRETAQREGLRRISLRNLAEYLLRLWAPVKVKPRGEGEEPWRPYA